MTLWIGFLWLKIGIDGGLFGRRDEYLGFANMTIVEGIWFVGVGRVLQVVHCHAAQISGAKAESGEIC
jgi:hypothetical protein